MSVPLLRLETLGMSFGDREILAGVDLLAARGEVVGLMGANGVGKSTLLRICAGLLLPRSGAALVQGIPAERARQRGWIGWSGCGEHAFQRRLSLGENLALCARLQGLRGGARVRRIREVAEMLGIEAQLAVPAECCSSGQRQRAAVARALMNRPPVVLLDEPLRGIDAESASRLARTLCAALRESAVLWVSHSKLEIESVADRVLRLEKGELHPQERRVQVA
jgi:ABC-type multidrug transport system ATPase subunit